MDHAAQLVAYRAPIVVTALYFGLWYGLLLGLQRGTKYKLIAEYAARGETFDRYFGQDGRMLAADRAVANTHEQMGPFLVAMWLHAVFVSPTQAAGLGLAYVLLRSAYPLLLGSNLSKTQSKRVFAVTGPCYAIVFYLLARVVVEALRA
ncbi:MAG: MAPEG family protein [Deltaproteobacteria bacterium]|nr:MAG: MAPEG family protein [Deltaproteobacteria bacterium]